MKHPPQPRILFHDMKTVAVRLPVVHDDRQVFLLREGQLAVKKLLLALFLRIVPVIVQADLTDGRAFRLFGERERSFKAVVGPGGKFLGVDAGRKPQGFVPRGKRGGVPAALFVAAGVQDQLDAGLPKTFDQRLPVFFKSFVVQMSVGIEIHGRIPFSTVFCVSIRIAQNGFSCNKKGRPKAAL